ncbi:MAG: hypothetical protein FJX77_00610 [Armatimonadetes bacterium]|nr:hypothetical protein [Armatimonadota bacterium]
MRKPARVTVVAIVVGLALLSVPVLAQLELFRLLPPENAIANGGQYLVRWQDSTNAITESIPSVTWYYSATADGGSRRRVATLLAEDFSQGLQARWRPEGPFSLDWTPNQEPRTGRRFVTGPVQGGPLLSLSPFPPDSVVSVLVRPRGLGGRFTIGCRTQSNSPGFQVRFDRDGLSLLESGFPVGQPHFVPGLVPNQWYWFELSTRTHRREVELRLRVFDESRKRALLCLHPINRRPGNRSLFGEGLIALAGNADFANVYVDPWSARWIDDPENVLRWDTSEVPSGAYFLIAELYGGPRFRQEQISPFQIEVRNPQAANDN